jgi:hypothetical protein
MKVDVIRVSHFCRSVAFNTSITVCLTVVPCMYSSTQENWPELLQQYFDMFEIIVTKKRNLGGL